jgi:hypothetical protein
MRLPDAALEGPLFHVIPRFHLSRALLADLQRLRERETDGGFGRQNDVIVARQRGTTCTSATASQ